MAVLHPGDGTRHLLPVYFAPVTKSSLDRYRLAVSFALVTNYLQKLRVGIEKISLRSWLAGTARRILVDHFVNIVDWTIALFSGAGARAEESSRCAPPLRNKKGLSRIVKKRLRQCPHRGVLKVTLTSQFQKLGWMTEAAFSRYEGHLKSNDLIAVFGKIDQDLKTEQITTEVFAIIQAMKLSDLPRQAKNPWAPVGNRFQVLRTRGRLRTME
ncbi:MAG TPA: hypothetical protein VJU84_00060 [Pyrinomonadaceae bacterium]|nr:hypothetical protein [Pyrinomonadaceae bacterium]